MFRNRCLRSANTRIENGKCFDVFLCYLCVHIILLLCFSCVFINGAQDIYVTNSTCGTELSLDQSDVIRFFYDGSKVYDPYRSIYRRCEIKITNNNKGSELCVWAPYSRYAGTENKDWNLKCSEMFQFGFTYRFNTMSCAEFSINEKCYNAKIAYATFREPFLHDEGLFIVRIFARYRAPTTTYDHEVDVDYDGEEKEDIPWIMILTAIFGSCILICACLCRVCKSQAGPGQHFGTNSTPNETFQVDMTPIPTERDSSLPPYLTGRDFNLTNHPSAPNGVCNVFPQLASASPHSGEPLENGAYTVPHRLPSVQSQCDEQPEKGAYNSKYSVEDSENRHTYRTPDFSTRNNNETSRTPLHTGTDLSELPPPPTYDMVMSADSLYLSSESDFLTNTRTNAVSSHYS